MSVAEVADLRAHGDALEVSPMEWVTFRRARHSGALAFYIELRRALRPEYEHGRPFHLQARKLAHAKFLPGRRDRKLYMRLVAELARLGLIECVKPAGFAADGRRVGALFMFASRRIERTDNIVFLAARRART
jgi:hypothetical protein